MNQRLRENPVADKWLKDLERFSAASASAVLKDAKGNAVFSPYSLYVGLSMAAYGANGANQEELLGLLGNGGEGRDYLAAQTGNLLRTLHLDNEIGQLKTANSVWLQQGFPVEQAYKKQLTDSFYASVFETDFHDPASGKQMGKWVAKHTNGLLSPDIKPDPKQVMTLLNTVYFRDQWVDRFDKSKTEPGPFYLEGGGQSTASYMHRTYIVHSYTKGEGFTSSVLALKNGGGVIFVLPDEGTSISSLLSSPDRVTAYFKPSETSAKVIFQVPKFSYSSSLPLNDTLQALGMKKAFQSNADFSNITKEQAYISSVRQEARIALDEDGVEAGAYTKLDYAGSAQPKDQIIEMILDRPFLYGIISRSGVLLFVGVCQDPSAR